jgi:hypothetical protein
VQVLVPQLGFTSEECTRPSGESPLGMMCGSSVWCTGSFVWCTHILLSYTLISIISIIIIIRININVSILSSSVRINVIMFTSIR